MQFKNRYLKEEEQQALFKVLKSQAGLLAQRDYAWMRLLLETGMRVNELATLTYRQAVDALRTEWLVVRPEQRKGHRAPGKDKDGNPFPVKREGHAYMVTHPVRECLVKLMELQQELRPAIDCPPEMLPPLLWGRCGVVKGKVLCEHMGVRAFQKRMKHWAQLANLPEGVSPHWLRHTRGVNIIRRSRGNNPLKVVQMALGHASIASTGIYTQMSREEFEAEMRMVAGGRMRKADARSLAFQG